MTDLRKITVVVSERDSPVPPAAPWPLIYHLEVSRIEDDSAILRQVADIRYDELNCEDQDDGTQSSLIDEICAGLELHFCFEGYIETLKDWRY